MSEIRTALISVSDKEGIADFAQTLDEQGVNILSTGGTAELLREAGVEVTDVADYTGFPEILDGRVKTLHPKIHGGLLALRDDAGHQQELDELDIQTIDMVVGNLYPFEHTISRPDAGLSEAVENIDIGGPTMIRAAAKNYTHVAVLTSPDDYDRVAGELKANDGELSEDTQFELARKAFEHTARYDMTIAQYLGQLETDSGSYPSRMFMDFGKRRDLRYGENPHQSAAFYTEDGFSEPCVSNAKLLSGKEPSFNNIIDINSALELVKEFEGPAATVIKHTNPCGAAVADNLADAYKAAYLGDPVSAFGSIVALNRPLDVETAQHIANFRAEINGERAAYFVEAVIAPAIQEDAMELIHEETGWGERTRFLETGELDPGQTETTSQDLRRVVGGLLVQQRDMAGFDREGLEVATDAEPNSDQMRDLGFAWVCCKHVKSNAITLAKDGMLVGAGAGQMSRVDATIISIRKAGDRAKGSVLASDAFFPFPDAVEKAAEAGVEAIIQPGGAKNDEAVAEAAEECGIPMVMTGTRHFRH